MVVTIFHRSMRFAVVLALVLPLVATASSSSSSSSTSNSIGAYGLNFFADSQNTYYDGYQQAWRYLGWYVKCGYPSDRYDQQQQGSHEKSHKSGDQNQRWQGNNYCQRYLIWAAYVDESYQGGGIGEYSIYDPYAKKWDNSACNAHGNGRCAPMDCHMNNSTTWKLMGVFKEAGYFGKDAFFEQLFKHEGVCLYDALMSNGYDFYEFMSTARQSSWTEGCVQTSVPITSSVYQYNSYYKSQQTDGYLYIDLKPTWNGNMTFGLYADSTCKYEYELPDADVDAIAKNMGLLYGSYLTAWNDGLEAYKVCQPCKAYNIANTYSTDEYYYSDSYTGIDSDPNAGYFQCNDDARYTNVNQCMKFRTHADLEVCTWEDLVTATNQGGILQVNVSGTIFGSERMSAADYKYLIRMRQEELTSEARQATQYRIDAARVENMKPEVKTWTVVGGVSLAAGLLCFLGAVCLLRRKHLGRPQEKQLKQPLVAKRDYFLSGPSGSMMTNDLDYCPSMHLSPNPTIHTLPNVDEEEEEEFAPVSNNARITELCPPPRQSDHPITAVAQQQYVLFTPPPPAQVRPSYRDDDMANQQEFGDDAASSMSSLSYVSNTPPNDKKVAPPNDEHEAAISTREATYNVAEDRPEMVQNTVDQAGFDEMVDPYANSTNEVTYNVVEDMLEMAQNAVDQTGFDEMVGPSAKSADEFTCDVVADTLEMVQSTVDQAGFGEIVRTSHQDEDDQDMANVIGLVNSYVESIGRQDNTQRQARPSIQHRRQGSLLDDCSDAEDSNHGGQADDSRNDNVPSGDRSPEREVQDDLDDLEDEIMAARGRIHNDSSTSF